MSLSRVAYLELVVTDLDRSVEHATRLLGLREAQRVGSSVYLTCNERHHELVLTEGDAPALSTVALEARSPEDLDLVSDRLHGFGIPTEETEVPGVSLSRYFLAPGGIRVELICGMATDQPERYDSVGARPRKFGHVTLASDFPAELEAVLCGPLGFRLSDRVPDVLSWFRCNADHHGLAIVPRDASGVHHYAFEMEGWATLEAFADHLADNGVPLIWGPGRHGPGRNLFTYHLDPSGAVVEVFADLQRIETDDSHTPREWAVEAETLNRWGPPPPPEFFDYLLPLR